jgi:Cu-processing system permease protein
MKSLFKYFYLDLIRSKFILGYALVLALFSMSALLMEDSTSKAVLTLLNLLLLIIPLANLLFACIYLYNSSEFIEMVLSHPVERKKLWHSLFLGLSSSLCTAYLVAVGLPLLFFVPVELALHLTVLGLILTIIFVALAFLLVSWNKDKAKGIGLSIIVWVYLSLLFDALVLFLIFQAADYPIEKPLVVLVALNPLDLVRILVLMKIDAAAMMGYTGAVFADTMGALTGQLFIFLMLLGWMVVPYYLSMNRFLHKDL